MSRVFHLLLAMVFLVAAPTFAAVTGPAVGTVAPALVGAVDAKGDMQTLSGLSGKQGLVLMFFRSASWCPYCKAQLITMNADAPAQLARRGYKLAALSYDSPEVLAKFAAERRIGFTLLSDEGSRTIDAYGLRDPQYPAESRAHGVPQPVILVIAPNGRVRAKLMEEGYKTRPPLEAVLAAIDSLR